MNTYIRLIKLVKSNLWVFFAAVGFMALSSVFDGVSLGMIVPLVDIILAGKDIVIPASVHAPGFIYDFVAYLNGLEPSVLLNYMIFTIIGLFFFKHLFTFLHSFLMLDLGMRVVRDIRKTVYDKVVSLSMDYFVRNQTGELVSRITYDTSVIKNATTESLKDLFYQPIQLLVYLVILLGVRQYFGIPWSLVLVTTVLVPCVVIPIIQIGKRLKKISTAVQKKMANINSMLFETLSGMKVVKAFATEEKEKNKFQQENQKFYKVTVKGGKRMLLVSPITEMAGLICMTVVLWIGGKEVVKGNLSPGAFLTFLAALLSLLKPFNRLSRVYSVNQQALAAADRIFDILDTDPTVQEAKDPVEIKKVVDKIEFKDVSFSYDQKKILNDINLSVKPGEVIAIVGRSGAGKTTLVNLVPRFYDPDSGQILMDGVDIKNASFSSLRSHIGIVTQETILFYDTVRNNVAYGNDDASLDEVIAAAKAANAHRFIEKLPYGYDTIIGERGFMLSGGERQRLAFARAILQNPPILILDEATSQLDTESERLVQEAVERLISGRTVFVIAHRLSTVQNASRILVIDGGRIAESGTHEELMKEGNLYKSLYDMQFGI